MPRTDGIDVSKWQGTIDWGAVAATGITWSACRTWDRDLHQVDQSFAYNRAGQGFCRHRLLYYWLEPMRALPGVDELFAAIGALAPGEGVMLDAEQDGITESDCLAWLEAVEARTGLPCAVYTGGYVAGGSIWRSTRIFDGRRARVFAAYSSEADAHRHAGGIAWDAWQWSSTGHVPGIHANCDLDQIDNPAAFDRVCGLGGAEERRHPVVASGHAAAMP
jgi:lysozyme